MLRSCCECAREIQDCNGFVVAGDVLDASLGKILWSDIRERCWLCTERLVLGQKLNEVGTPTHCTAAVVLNDRQEILLGLRNYKNDKWKEISVWTTPGGRCNKGETLGSNLRRETYEEVGITQLDILHYLCSAPGAKDPDIVEVFVCRSKETPQLCEPDKFTEWRWFPTTQIPQNFINQKIKKSVELFIR